MTRTDTTPTRTPVEATAHHPPAADHERSKVREGFVWHLGTYLIMMGFFCAIALMADTGFRWVLWVAIPWGLGLAFHALAFVVEGTRLVRRD